MSTFKVGNKVRALSSGHHQITKGEVYSVVGVDERSHGGELVYVTGNSGMKASQYAYRFELVAADPVFKSGQRVKLNTPWREPRGFGRVLEWKDAKHKDGKLIAVAHETWEGGHSGYGEVNPSSYAKGNNVWFYDTQYLELAEETRRFIVILEKDGKLLPAIKPREYATFEQAAHVAKDMTKKHNDTFFVFEATFIAKPVTKLVETVEAEGMKL